MISKSEYKTIQQDSGSFYPVSKTKTITKKQGRKLRQPKQITTTALFCDSCYFSTGYSKSLDYLYYFTGFTKEGRKGLGNITNEYIDKLLDQYPLAQTYEIPLLNVSLKIGDPQSVFTSHYHTLDTYEFGDTNSKNSIKKYLDYITSTYYQNIFNSKTLKCWSFFKIKDPRCIVFHDKIKGCFTLVFNYDDIKLFLIRHPDVCNVGPQLMKKIIRGLH